jgi:hypothetical protein
MTLSGAAGLHMRDVKREVLDDGALFQGLPTASIRSSTWASFSKEDVAIIDTRSDISKISKNRLTHFVLDRILLSAAMLGAPNGEDFTLPIKILQTQVDDLTRAQSIDRKQKQEGPGANMLRVIPSGQF